MTTPAVLWIHAIVALAFGFAAVDAARRLRTRRWLTVSALALAACWALAIAGIGARESATRLAEGLATIAWLTLMTAIARATDRGRALSILGGVLVVASGLALLAAMIADVWRETAAGIAARDAHAVIAMLVAAGALIFTHALATATRRDGAPPLMIAAFALAWTSALMAAFLAYMDWGNPAAIATGRGLMALLVAILFVIGGTRGVDRATSISRAMATRSAVGLAIGGYMVLIALGTSAIGVLAGRDAAIVQTAFVCGATVALATLGSNAGSRAWLKVVIAKHFYRHRYDYRDEWLRFTATIGAPGDRTLEMRVTKAIADLTDSPAAILLVPEEGGMGMAAHWNWPEAPLAAAGPPLAAWLVARRRIVALDAVRAGDVTADEAAAVPAWAIADRAAWAIVPLLHFDALVGAIVLARPAIDRAPDWEDFDLLRLAGAQVASYLAEDRAHSALGEAQRFDEFNRRFAFIMHDLKNLVSQLTLVARNAERHAENPDFRADMVATLKESSGRMNALLARLSQNHGRAEAPARAVPLLALARAIADARRAQHSVDVSGDDEVLALADAGALETLIGHLVQNAIEASDDGDPVMLVVGRDADRAAIDVIDRGHGMSAAFVREKLFRPFVSTRAGGFGIGAFEARQLTEAMGGAITVASREREGTRFRVTLPLARAAEQAA